MKAIHYLRYAAVYVATGIGLSLLFSALQTYLGIDRPTGVSMVLNPMVPAMIEGQSLARRQSEPLTSGAAWRAAGVMTLMVAAISLLQLSLVSLGGVDFTNPLILGFALFGVLVALAVNRYFFASIFRNTRAAIEKSSKG